MIKLTLESSVPSPIPGGSITVTDTYRGPLTSVEHAERVGREAGRPGDTVRIFEDGRLVREWLPPDEQGVSEHRR